MALIHNNKRFIFFHLYKCGGNSLRKIFNEHAKGTIELMGVHSNASDMQKHYVARGKGDVFNDMFKFTFVRNPFDFLLSTYFYARKSKGHFWHQQAMSMPFKDFPALYIKEMEFHKKRNLHGSNRVTSLYDWIINEEGEVIIDFIGKLENLEEDTKTILKRVNVVNVPVPKVNVNKLNNKPYQEVIDGKTRAFIEKHFAKDFEYFNYEW